MILEGPGLDRQLSTLRPTLGRDANRIGNLVIPCDTFEFRHHLDIARVFSQRLHARELGELGKVTPGIAPATFTIVIEIGLGILFERTAGGDSQIHPCRRNRCVGTTKPGRVED